MGRAETHLAAFAVGVVFLLAGGNCAIAAADTPDSTGGEKSSTAASDSGPGAGGNPSANPTGNNDTDGGGGAADNTKTLGAEADKTAEDQGGGTPDPVAAEPGDGDIKKPVDHETPKSDTSEGKTISRIPLRPQAPPALDLVPPPAAPPPVIEAPPPIVESPPPPADLPPAVPPAPAAPVDPGVVDAVAGEAEHHPGSDESPVLNLPFIATPGVYAPPHLLGASVVPRWAGISVAAGPTPRWGNGRGSATSPRRVRASTDGTLLREPSSTYSGLSPRTGDPYRTAVNESVRRPVSEMAAGALPGVAGIVLMTASGICLGYRQARTGQLLRTAGADRFMN